MRYLIVAVVVIAILALIVWRLHSAPSCTCGDIDCGGGCLPRR